MKSKLIRIQGREIRIPEPERRDRSLIIGLDEKPENAMWRRQTDIPKQFFDYNILTKINQPFTLYNQDGILTHLSEKDTDSVAFYLKRELHRRRYGVHCNIEGEVIWIHPDYYFNLQWAKMLGLSSQWGDFRWFQNDYLIDRGWNIQDPNVAGMFCTKPKKTGISQILAGAYVNHATMNEQQILGMMSKSGDDVKDVCLTYFFHIFDNMPYIMQPKWKKRNLSEIIFGRPAGRASSSKASLLTAFKDARDVKVLNTRVFGAPTKESGFDGPVINLGWIDEFPKTWEGSSISPDALYKKTIETVKKQMTINGFLDYTSYAPEIDDRGFEEAKKIWNASKKIKKETGRTESNLVPHFISVMDAMEGLFFKNGRCDRKKALHFINAELGSKTETSEKQRIRRQYPVTESDSWGAGGTGTTFDNVRLSEIHGEVEAAVLAGAHPYQQGRFRWINEEWENGTVARPKGIFCPVVFQPLNDAELMAGIEGRSKLLHDIPYEHRNAALLRNSRHEDDDKLCPLPETIYVGSFDPTDYKKKKDVQEGSKNAGHTMNLQSAEIDTMYQGTASNILLSEYFFRPDHPDEAYEDLVKEIIYFGKFVIVEANKGWVVTKLLDDGLVHFLLLKKSDGSIGPYQPGSDLHYVYTTDTLIEDYCREISLYIAAPKTVGTPDYGRSLKSMQLLKQLMDFDPLNTKKFDLAVSLGLCRLAARAFSVFRREMLDAQGGMYNRDAMEAALNGLLNF